VDEWHGRPEESACLNFPRALPLENKASSNLQFCKRRFQFCPTLFLKRGNLFPAIVAAISTEKSE
jgi:hypothetical protein